MNPKYQKVLSDIEKAEKKKTEIEGQLKELYDKKTELENLEIINTLSFNRRVFRRRRNAAANRKS